MGRASVGRGQRREKQAGALADPLLIERKRSRWSGGREKEQEMRHTRGAAAVRGRGQRPVAAKRMSYEQLAAGLAFEMAECVLSCEAREFCAPFELVIVDSLGAVVFECEVGEDGRVWHDGRTRVVRRSHFPATALLTDRSLVTRTFQIERASC